MKQIKLFLLAAMIIGAASAFKTATPMVDGLWVPSPTGEGILLKDGQDAGGACDDTYDEPCYYQNQLLTIPAEDAPIGRFVYQP